MKLLFLYVDDYRCHRKRNMNFDGTDRFLYRDGRLTCIESAADIPQTFFSVCDTGKAKNKSRVESVSVIVGENGAGKTSLACLLNQILSGGKVPCRYVVVARIDDNFVCHENIGVEFDDRIPREKYGVSWVHRPQGVDQSPIAAYDFGILYYSPYFNATPTFAIGESDAFVDLSTTGLLHRSGDVKMCSAREEATTLRMINRIGRRLKKSEKHSGPLPTPGLFEVSIDWDYIVSIERMCSERSRKISKRLLYENVHRRIRRKLISVSPEEEESQCFAWFREALDIADFRDPVLGILAGYLAQLIESSRRDDALRPDADSYLMALCNVANELCAEIYGGSDLDERPDLWPINSRSRAYAMTLTANRRKQIREESVKRLKAIRVNTDEMSIHKQFLAVLADVAALCGDMPLSQNGEYTIPVDGIEDQRLFYQLRADYLKLQKNERLRRSIDFLSFGNAVMSSGERAFLSLMGRLDECIGDDADIKENGLRCDRKNLLLFLDEAETTLHPEWQRSLVKNVIWYIERLTVGRRVHVIFATHSPTLLSDVPSGNVVVLPRRGDTRNECHLTDIQTFGLNVFDLYRGLFNTHDGMMGHFAKDKINDLLRKVDKRSMLSEDDRRIIDLVGDSLIRDFLNRENP